MYIKEVPYFDPILFVSQLSLEANFVFFDSASHSLGNCAHSYICYDPYSIISCDQGLTFIDKEISNKKPLAVIAEKLNSFQGIFAPDSPFFGGLAGFIGYDFINYLEPKIKILKKDEMAFPDLMMGLFDLVLAFDHKAKRCWIYSSGLPEKHHSLRKLRAKDRCQEVIKLLNECKFSYYQQSEIFVDTSEITSNLTYQEYCAGIKKTLDYIQAGDIYQANISQRFECRLPSDLTPMDVYKRLRKGNSAPFCAYLKLNDNIIASASPERFIQARNGSITTSPIKGTSKRNSNPLEDHSLALGLHACEKNRAENLMIVDLMRNDLSRVCEHFSVKVPKIFSIESYATVHHLVSTIQGKLKEGCSLIDLLAATFPGGSITGAPKLRAIEIIDQIEKVRRGPYCGSIGYLGANGVMDTSILIRTFVIKGQNLTFHVGGGVVADSTPHDEYIETLVKANALYPALANRNIKIES